jgi:GPH family glycoside/pentoside/hexuronide:cation symporter
MAEKKTSSLTMASYGVGKFLAEFLTGAYGIMVYYFYESEMHLDALYVTIATVIYSIWNAVNDPLIGYITGKSNRFTKKFGRHTPWILSGLLFCSLAYVGIFAVPSWVQASPVRLFFWMVVFVCLYDGCYSLWEVNYQGVFPNKFRTTEERSKTAVIATSIGVFGIALGAVLPPLFYSYGKPESFAISALIIGAIGLVGAVLIRRGVRETPEMKKSKEIVEQQDELGFFKSLSQSLKHREFLALLLMLFFYQSACMCMTGSVNYVVSGVLGMKSSATTPIFAGMLVGALVSILVWRQVAKRIRNNNQKLLVITSFAMAVACSAMFFANSQITFAVGMFAWGLGFGGFWTFMTPAMADVVDSVVVSEKRREDGVLMGVRAFFMRLSYTSQAIVFWLCHKATGYDSTVSGIQAPLARTGIKLHISLVPAVFFVIAAMCMLFINTLTPEKVESNKEELRKLGL